MYKILKTLGIIAILILLTSIAQAGNLSTIHIGYQPSTHQIAAMLASEKGWWEDDLSKFGIEEVKLYSFPSGPPEVHAMLAGDIDVAYVGVAPPIAALYEGLDAKIVAGVQTQGSAIVIRPELADEYEGEGPQSLKGKTIATFPPGSIQHAILSKWLLDNGVDPEEDVDIKAMGPSDAVTAIGAKTIDAVFLPSPTPTIIVEEGNGVIVEWSGSMWPNHACCCVVASGKMIREHPEILKQIIKTHISATEYEIEHPEEAAEIYAKWQGTEVSTLKQSIDITDLHWIHDPGVEVESSLEYARVIYELNRERYEAKGIKSLREEDIFDTSFYDEIMGTPTPTSEPTPIPTLTATPTATPAPPSTVTPTPTPPVFPISPEYLYAIPIALFLILLPLIFYIRGKRKKPAKTPEMPPPSPEQKVKEEQITPPISESITIERAIYDPCKRDFIEGQLPRMKEWINRYDPGAYWFATSIQNNTDKTIEEWGVDLEFSSALKIEEAKIEGIEYEIPHEAHLGAFKISVPKEYGIVIPKGGAQRVYFKLRAEKPKTTYKISGVFKSEITGDVLIRAKEFQYLCDAGVPPEAVKAELKKTFSEKEAARLALSFKTVQEIDRMCNQETKTEEYLDKLSALKNYTAGFSDTFTNQVADFSRFMEQEQLGYLDDEYKGKVRRFCTNLVDVWISEFLKG